MVIEATKKNVRASYATRTSWSRTDQSKVTVVIRGWFSGCTSRLMPSRMA